MSKAGSREILWAAALSLGLALPALAAGHPAKAPAQPEKPAAAAPAAKGTLDLAYELRFWFIPFGHTTYRGVFAGSTYQASSYFKTSGLVSVFWQAEIDAGASGSVDSHDLSPSVYDSYYRRGSGKKQRVKLTYRSGAPPELFSDPPYDTKKYPVTDKEKEEGVDPMSAVTLIALGVKADANNPCGTVAPVFDGRRRYDVELSYVKDETVKLDSKIYQGAAHLCRVRYHEIAGYKQEILKKGSGWPSIYALVADVSDAAAPLGRYTVPLKLWADTSYGKVSAEITALKTGGDAKG